MLKLLKYLFFASLFFAFTGCYKDLGNYKYNKINQVEIKSDSTDIIIAQQDTLRIKVQLTETMSASEGLSYQWVMYAQSSAPLTRRIVDSTKDLNAIVTETPGSYTLDYFVTDKKTGVQFQKRYNIKVVGAFGAGWLVLDEKNGGVDLNLIAEGDKIFKNIYSTTNKGEKLPAGSNKITIASDLFGSKKIFILAPDNAVQLYPIDFMKIKNFNELFYSAPAPKPTGIFIKDFNTDIINNGKVYTINAMTGAGGSFGLAIPGNYYMAPHAMYSVYDGFVFYDEISKGFLIASDNNELDPFNEFDPAKSAFDMNHIGKKLLYTDINGLPPYSYNCVFKNLDDDSVFIYQMDFLKQYPATAKLDVTKAENLAKADYFAQSMILPLMYYTFENKIYKLDVFAQTSSLIYTFPEGTQVAGFKMLNDFSVYGTPDFSSVIVVATNEGTQGKVYRFNIGSTGNFEGNTYSKVYTGFNKISAIAYNY